MDKYFRLLKLFICIAVALSVFVGIAAAGINEETVASVNGEKITGLELRESFGFWGGTVSASGVPLDKKKETLERLIGGRLIEQAARSKKLDNTADFSSRFNEGEEGLLLPALFRMEISGLKVDEEEVKAEAVRLRKEDKNLSKESARMKAKMNVWQKEIRKREQELIAAAREDASIKVDEQMIERIAKGEKAEDNVVLGAGGVGEISYGELKVLLQQIGGGGHSGANLGTDPQLIRFLLDRELSRRALLAYARKRNIEGSDWMKAARRELQRAILIDLFTEKEIFKGIKASEKEISDAYSKHSQMLVRDGKKIPLSEVKEDIRNVVLKEKRSKALRTFLEKRKVKAKIRVNEKLLPKV